MAAQIEFVSFDMIQIRDKELKSHWYKSEHIDLYYYQLSSGKLAKFHISLFGQVLEWSPKGGSRTGLLVEEERQDAVFEAIQFDLRPNLATIAQAVLVLKNALCVESHVREELLRYFESVLKNPVAEKSWFSGIASFFRKLLRR